MDFTDRIVQTADRPKLEAPPAGTAFGNVNPNPNPNRPKLEATPAGAAFGNVSLDGQPRSISMHVLTTAPFHVHACAHHGAAPLFLRSHR